MANMDRGVQSFNDRQNQMHQERLARFTHFEEGDLVETTERLTKTVKQARGVKLQSLDPQHHPTRDPVGKLTASGAPQEKFREGDQTGGVMPFEQLQILQETHLQAKDHQRPQRPRGSRQRPSSSLPGRKPGRSLASDVREPLVDPDQRVLPARAQQNEMNLWK